MKKLIYAPHGLFSPERELIHTVAINSLMNGDNVELIYCKGGACSINPLAVKALCNVCVKKNIELSKCVQNTGDYNSNLKITFYENTKTYNLDFNKPINSTTYKNEDLGYAVMSTYIGITRDFEPDITNEKVKRILYSLASTFKSTYDFFEEKLNSEHFDEIHIFNGRLNNSRAVLRASLKSCGMVFSHELVGLNDDVQYFINCLPHDLEANQCKINDLYQQYLEEAETLAFDFYSKKKHGKAVNDKSYVTGQKNQLPESWDDNNRNITFFTSSEDEFKAIGKEWEGGVFSDQVSAIKGVLNCLTIGKDILYVRIHPNVRYAAKKYLNSLMELKHPCLRLIHPSSKVSSYLLMEKSDVIITYGSTIGIEAAYWGKVSILLSRSFYKGLGSTYEPETYDELRGLLTKGELVPLSNIGAVKLGVFYKKNGSKIFGFKGSKSEGYSFFDCFLELNLTEKIIYKTIKGYQKVYSKCFLK